MNRLVFHVAELDCPEEMSLLRRALSPLVGDETRLAFDIISRRMSVDVTGLTVTPEALTAAARTTGLSVLPLDLGPPNVLSGKQPGPQPIGCACCDGICDASGNAPGQGAWWASHGRIALCAVSGAALALGLVVETVSRGSFLEALAGEGASLLGGALWLTACGLGVWRVLPRAWASLKSLRPDMNLLMVVAVIGAIGLGDLFEAASVAFLFAVANELESWSVGRARHAVAALLDLAPSMAHVLEPVSGTVSAVPVETVATGTRLVVKPGEKIPLDGRVESGTTAVNQAPITGESMPVSKGPGDEVFAGTLNGDGGFEMVTTKPHAETTLVRILHMVEAAQSRRAESVRLVERFAAVYTPAMVGVATAVCLLPPLLGLGTLGEWFYNALVLLVISCPCALVISTPVSVVAALASAARMGALVKGGVYLEVPATISAVVFDKTGTLTTGAPAVTEVRALGAASPDEALALAAALETRVDHPVARAVVREAGKRGLALPAAREVQVRPGLGVTGLVAPSLVTASGERKVFVGGPRYLAETLGDEAARSASASAPDSTVFVWDDSDLLGAIRVEDQLRPTARRAVEELRTAGVTRIAMLTGDGPEAAGKIAAAAGVNEVRHSLLPEDKTAFVEALKAEGAKVAVVGDGVNDAPAMAASHLGVAMGGSGQAVTVETADVALMTDDPARLAWLIRHSRRTTAIIRQNVGFAIGIKGAILAMTLFGAGSLWLAIVADIGSTLAVVANALRLLKAER